MIHVDFHRHTILEILRLHYGVPWIPGRRKPGPSNVALVVVPGPRISSSASNSAVSGDGRMGHWEVKEQCLGLMLGWDDIHFV